MSDFLKWFMALLCAIVVGSFALGYIYLTRHFPGPRANDPDCCKPDQHPPAPKDGLRLHRWYRTKVDISWCWKTRIWDNAALINHQGRGLVLKGTPLYVVARHGNVAVLRGAVKGEILVPDGDSAVRFQLLEQGEIGDEPPPPKKEDPRGEHLTFLTSIPVRDVAPETLPPPIPNLAGRYGVYSFQQSGRNVWVYYHGFAGHGTIRDDGAAVIFWIGNPAYVSIYRLCENGEALAGTYALANNFWEIRGGELVGQVYRHTMRRSAEPERLDAEPDHPDTPDP